MQKTSFKYFPHILISFLIVTGINAILRQFVTDLQILSVIMVLLHAVIMFLIFTVLDNKVKNIFIVGFLLRLIFLFWDIYAKNIFKLPNSGTDSEMYYRMAVMVSENFSLFSEDIRGGLYSKIIGTLFSFIGPQRIYAQYCNVLAGVIVLIIIYEIMTLLNITSFTKKRILMLSAFFPNSIIMSAILLREMLPTLFVSLSLYYFIKWYKVSSYNNVILSITFIGIAAMFHSGVIGLFIGYFFVFLFYKHQSNQFRFSFRSIITFIFIGGFAYLVSNQFGDMMFGKFQDLEGVDDLYAVSNNRLGGSVYLTSMQINNPVQFLLYGPIKMLYFLTVPLPWNWRNGMDVFSFLFDSMLYIFAIFRIFKNWKYLSKEKTILIGLIVSLICVAFVFGIGVGNAGTAIRHRQKIISLVLIMIALTFESKNILKYKPKLLSKIK